MFSPAAAVLPHIQAGTLKALASTPAKRPSTAPNLPTMTEAGVDLDASLWFAIWAPSGTSREVIEEFSRTGNEAIKTAEAQTIFTAQGFRRSAARQEIARAGPRVDEMERRGRRRQTEKISGFGFFGDFHEQAATR